MEIAVVVDVFQFHHAVGGHIGTDVFPAKRIGRVGWDGAEVGGSDAGGVAVEPEAAHVGGLHNQGDHQIGGVLAFVGNLARAGAVDLGQQRSAQLVVRA